MGSVVTFRCLPGHLFNDGTEERHLVCQQDQTWSWLFGMFDGDNCKGNGHYSPLLLRKQYMKHNTSSENRPTDNLLIFTFLMIYTI